MNIFLTGATGYLGGAIARELTAAGHTVTGPLRKQHAQAASRPGRTA
jgi:uncharacterized protein YbjT (DUF2867 family)